MSFQKQITIPGGTVSVSEQSGKVLLEISVQESVGGGKAKDICQVEGDAKVTLSAKQAVDLAFAVIEEHLPASASAIAKEIQAFADMELDSV